jgi:hypothetical protein
MTKEEIIKNAYVQYWDKVKNNVDENGWCDGSYNLTYLDLELNMDDCEFLNFDSSDIWRPISLKGIDDNNGWIKIESKDDLPNCGNYWVVYKDGKISDLSKDFDLVLEDDDYWLKNVTHYQPINKPISPLY